MGTVLLSEVQVILLFLLCRDDIVFNPWWHFTSHMVQVTDRFLNLLLLLQLLLSFVHLLLGRLLEYLTKVAVHLSKRFCISLYIFVQFLFTLRLFALMFRQML